MRARVTAAYATVKVADAAGKPTVVGLYAGAPFPDNADPDSVAMLVRRGYAEWIDEPAQEPEAPAAVPDPPPAANAPKADWVAYAVAQRPDDMSEEDAFAEAEAKTKADLIAEYGG